MGGDQWPTAVEDQAEDLAPAVGGEGGVGGGGGKHGAILPDVPPRMFPLARSARVGCDQIYADGDPSKLHGACVVKQTEIIRFPEVGKSRRRNEVRQNLQVEARRVIVVFVDVSAKHHSHDVESLIDIELIAGKE